MTVCEDCKKEYHTVESCTFKRVSIEGVLFPREGAYEKGKEFNQTIHKDEAKMCDDCGITIGHIHHKGCTIEICPRCKECLATCGCDDVETLKK